MSIISVGFMSKKIVTSALPYINGIPHLGNLVGSILPADIYYKYLLMKNEDAIFICGSDQHGTPIELSALKKGIPTEKFADDMHEKVKKALLNLECTFTYYGKTHTEINKKIVYDIFNALMTNGFIIKVENIQAFCNFDKRFIPDRMIEGTCPFCNGENARGDQCDDCGKLLDPKDIVNPACNICGKHDISFKNTKNLALDLSALSNPVKEFIESIHNDISKNALNKTLSYIEGGLKPREITRDLKWGFEVPLDEYDNKVFYVWFDAVIGYIGITKEWSVDRAELYWKDNSTELIQFMGKDNIEFHTTIWPAILLGSDIGYVLPSKIMAYEFLLSKSIKFSKSRGIGLNIENALDIFGADYWRFVLAYMLPETSDTEFSVGRVYEIINKIMNDKIGNLIHRAMTIAKRNKGIIENIVIDEEYSKEVESIIKRYIEDFDSIHIREALKDIVKLADLGNVIMSNKKPWELIDTDKSKFLSIIGTVLKICKYISIMIWPFTPCASIKALKHFGIDETPKLSMMREFTKFYADLEESQMFFKMGDKEINLFDKFS